MGESVVPRALDLFSGTGAVGDRLREWGFEVVTLDSNPRCKATFCCNILDWDYKQFPPGYFQVIAAGVPCQEYSVAKTRGTRKMEEADKLVDSVFEILRYFQPNLWWIENPRGGFLKSRQPMQNVAFIDVDYCQFSDFGYQKPTRIWGPQKITCLPDVLCANSCNQMVLRPNGRWGHRFQLGGYKMKHSTRQKYRTPPRLIDYLLQAFEPGLPLVEPPPVGDPGLKGPMFLRKMPSQGGREFL